MTQVHAKTDHSILQKYVAGGWILVWLLQPSAALTPNFGGFLTNIQYIIITVPLVMYIKSIPTTNQTELAQLLAT